MANPVIMWFRQDLRLADNAAFAAAAAAGPVIPAFILDDETPGEWAPGGASRWWLHKSLLSLSRRLPLVLRRGRAELVLDQLLAETGAGGVCFTRDYSPRAPSLEQRVKEVCERRGATCRRYGGYLLQEPEAVRTGAGQPYKVYTPFARACRAGGEPRAPRPQPDYTVADGLPSGDRLDDWRLHPVSPDWSTGFSLWEPGEEGARRRLLAFLSDGLDLYADGRDRPDLPATSRLSAHLHWGEISPAQVWTAARNAAAEAEGRADGSVEKFLSEVLWREFSYHLLWHWPDLPEKSFRPGFNDFPWRSDEYSMEKWKRGETGYPLVDAGMRELWSTGTMHNRVRMVVSSFLIKHLLVSWQTGERWFWDTLVDADMAANAASWQWVAGCGADAAPYFRIFNPVKQGETFDPDGAYVRRWVPELADVERKFIHAPWLAPCPPKAYPPPMIDHGFARQRALDALKAAKMESF